MERRHSSRYSVQRSFLFTPFRRSSLRTYSKSGIRFEVAGFAFTSGKSNLPKTGSLSLGSRGQIRFCSLAAFSTLLTVVLDALQLRAMLVWLRFNPASRMISRYLVIMVTSFVMNLRCKAYEFIIKETVPSDRNLGIRFPESRYRLKRNSGTVAPERRFRIARNTQDIMEFQVNKKKCC